MSAVPDDIRTAVLPSTTFTPVTFTTPTTDDTAAAITHSKHTHMYMFVLPTTLSVADISHIDLHIPKHKHPHHHHTPITHPVHLQCLTPQYCLYEISPSDYTHVKVLMPVSADQNDVLTTTKPLERCFHIMHSQHQHTSHSDTDHTARPTGNPAFAPPAQPSMLGMPYKPFGFVPTVNDAAVDTRNGVAHARRTFEQKNGVLRNTAAADVTVKPEPVSASKSRKQHKHERSAEKSSSSKSEKKHKKKHKADD